MTRSNRNRIIISIVSVLLILLMAGILFDILSKESSQKVYAEPELILSKVNNDDGNIVLTDNVTLDTDYIVIKDKDTGIEKKHYTKNYVTGINNTIPEFQGKKAVEIQNADALYNAIKQANKPNGNGSLNADNNCYYLTNDIIIDRSMMKEKSTDLKFRGSFYGNGYNVNIVGGGGDCVFKGNKVTTISDALKPKALGNDGTDKYRPIVHDTLKDGTKVGKPIYSTGLLFGSVESGAKITSTNFTYNSAMESINKFAASTSVLNFPKETGMISAGILAGMNFGELENCSMDIQGIFTVCADGDSSMSAAFKWIHDNCAIVGGLFGINANGGKIQQVSVNIDRKGEVNAYTRGAGSLTLGKDYVWPLAGSACAISGGIVGNFIPTNKASIKYCTISGEGLVQSVVGYADKGSNNHSYAGAVMGTAAYFGGEQNDASQCLSVVPLNIMANDCSIENIMSSYVGRIKHNYNVPLLENMRLVKTEYAKLFGYMAGPEGIKKMIILFDFQAFCKGKEDPNPGNLTTLDVEKDGDKIIGWINKDIKLEELGVQIYATDKNGQVKVKQLFGNSSGDVEITGEALGNTLPDEYYTYKGSYKAYAVNNPDIIGDYGGIVWGFTVLEKRYIHPFTKVQNKPVGSFVYRLSKDDVVGAYTVTFGEAVDYSYYTDYRTKDYDGTPIEPPQFELKSYLGNSPEIISSNYQWYVNKGKDQTFHDTFDFTSAPDKYIFQIGTRVIYINDSKEKEYYYPAYYDEKNRIIAYDNESLYSMYEVKPINIDVTYKNTNAPVISSIWKNSFNVNLTLPENFRTTKFKMFVERSDNFGKIEKEIIPTGEGTYSYGFDEDPESFSNASLDGYNYIFKAYDEKDKGKLHPLAQSKLYENILIDNEKPVIEGIKYYYIVGDTYLPIEDPETMNYTKYDIRVNFTIKDRLSGVNIINLPEDEYVINKSGEFITYEVNKILSDGRDHKVLVLDKCNNKEELNLKARIDRTAPSFTVSGTPGANIAYNGVFNEAYEFLANISKGDSDYDLFMSTYSPVLGESAEDKLANVKNISAENWNLIQNPDGNPSGQYEPFLHANVNDRLKIDRDVDNSEIWLKLVGHTKDIDNQYLFEPVYVQLKHKEGNVETELFTINITYAKVYVSIDDIYLKSTNTKFRDIENKAELFNKEYNNFIVNSTEEDKRYINVDDVLELKFTKANFYYTMGSDCYDVQTAAYEIWAHFENLNTTNTVNNVPDKKVTLSIRYAPFRAGEIITPNDSRPGSPDNGTINYQVRFPIQLIDYTIEKELLTGSPDDRYNGSLLNPIDNVLPNQEFSFGDELYGSVSKSNIDSNEFKNQFETYYNKKYIEGGVIEAPNSYEYETIIPSGFEFMLDDGTTQFVSAKVNICDNQYSNILGEYQYKNNFIDVGYYILTPLVEENEHYVFDKAVIDNYKVSFEIIPKEISAIFTLDEDIAPENWDGNFPNLTFGYDTKEHFIKAYVKIKDPNLDYKYTYQDVLVKNYDYLEFSQCHNDPVEIALLTERKLENAGKYISYFKLGEEWTNYCIVNNNWTVTINPGEFNLDIKTQPEEYNGKEKAFNLIDKIDLDPNIIQSMGVDKLFTVSYHRYNDSAIDRYNKETGIMPQDEYYDPNPMVGKPTEVGFYKIFIKFKGYKPENASNYNYAPNNWESLMFIDKAHTTIDALDINLSYDGKDHKFSFENTYIHIYGTNTNAFIGGIELPKDLSQRVDNPWELSIENTAELERLLGTNNQNPLIKLQYRVGNDKYQDVEGDKGMYKTVGVHSYKIVYLGDKNNQMAEKIVNLNIVKAKFKQEEIKFEGLTIDYDSKDHSISAALSGNAVGDKENTVGVQYQLLENGKIVDRSKDPFKFKNAGTYTIRVSVKKNNFEEFISDPVDLIINEIAPPMGIKILGGSFTYDGQAHGVEIIGLIKENNKYYFEDGENKVEVNISGDKDAITGFIDANEYKGNIVLKANNYLTIQQDYVINIAPAKAEVIYDNIKNQLEGQDYTKFDFRTLKAQYVTNGETLDCNVVIMKVEKDGEVPAVFNEDGTLPSGEYMVYALADSNYVVKTGAPLTIGEVAAESNLNQKTIVIIASSVGGGVVLIGLIVGIIIAVKKKKNAGI